MQRSEAVWVWYKREIKYKKRKECEVLSAISELKIIKGER